MAFTRIQLRRGTAAQWANADPVLAVGEPGVETDTGVFKVGNGEDAWSALAPVGPADADPVTPEADLTVSGNWDFTGVLSRSSESVETEAGAQAKADASEAAVRAEGMGTVVITDAGDLGVPRPDFATVTWILVGVTGQPSNMNNYDILHEVAP